MRELWIRFQDGRWWWRLSIKGSLLAVTLFLVCFPYPAMFVRNVQHWRNPNALIEPDAPQLAPLLAELRPMVEGVPPGPDVLKVVQDFVYQKVPYAWDWDTWGVADYLPTLGEVLTAGREDCDGQALVSASLLRNLGYKADLVTDLMHVWVKTEHGETMSPGRLTKAVEGSDEGLRIHWEGVRNIPRSLAYGVAVFPRWREIIVLCVFWLLALRPGMGRLAVGSCLVMLVGGLEVLRRASENPWRDPEVAWQAVGLVGMLVGACLLTLRGRDARRIASAKG